MFKVESLTVILRLNVAKTSLYYNSKKQHYTPYISRSYTVVHSNRTLLGSQIYNNDSSTCNLKRLTKMYPVHLESDK